MGRIYGIQWRKWDNQIDQLNQVVESIKREPNSRRHLVTAWNPSDLNDMCLPPCHYSFQFYVDGYYLNCLFNMRSVDVFLGLPFDIASYALLTELVAQDTNLVPGEMTVMLGDTHIYLNHFDQVLEVLKRDPRPLPLLELDQEAGINNFHPSMARLAEYDPHPAVQAPLNV
jgi:thymidylate synthase